MFIALATGFVAGYAHVRRHISGTIFGVAISISLIPPLSVTGIGLAHADQGVFVGSGLLFITNLVSIIFSGVLSFLLLEIQYFRRNLRSLLVPTAAILALVVPLSFGFMAIRQTRVLENELTEILESKTMTFRDLDIESIRMDVFANPIPIEVVVRTTENEITPKQVHLVEEYLEERVREDVLLTVYISPVIRISGNVDDESQKSGILKFLPPIPLFDKNPPAEPVTPFLPPVAEPAPPLTLQGQPRKERPDSPSANPGKKPTKPRTQAAN